MQELMKISVLLVTSVQHSISALLCTNNENHKIEIDPFLCVGCSACIDDLCPTGAFEKVEERVK